MKTRSVTIAAVPLLLAVILGSACPSIADAGVFTGNGQDLRQITSKTIQLGSIDVTIVLGRGRFLFDGTVPGMDVADYECTFVLRNLSDKDEEVQVGFPVDSEFARQYEQPVSSKGSKEWVFDYGFIARDEKTTYNVDFVRRKPETGPGEFGSVFVWKMFFAPKESKTLSVQYHIPMSMGLVSSYKEENLTGHWTGALSQELLNIAQLEMAGYVTSTGASWAGNVETATFTVITKPFERYLNQRGITEENPSELNAEEAARFQSSFPVLHPWWFRQIEPAGWQTVKGGVQWHYENFKPRDPINVRYYMTQFPQLPGEVDTFVDRFLKGLGPKESVSIELENLREILLATYGKEPRDAAVRAFADAQIWYAPRKDFSMNNLSKVQKAILAELNARISAAKGK